MSTATITYTDFVNGTPAEADQVDQNFDDILNYINTEVIVRDAAVAFTSIPSGPNSDPTTANQFTRKQYVDQYSIPVYQSQGAAIDIQTQPVAENQLLFGGGSAVVITDPGYNLTLTGQGFVTLVPSTANNPLNIWECKVKVNGTIQSVFRIPLVGATGQSVPFVLPATNVSTGGGNHTIQLFTENVSGTGYTADVDTTSTTRCFFVSQRWRR